MVCIIKDKLCVHQVFDLHAGFAKDEHGVFIKRSKLLLKYRNCKSENRESKLLLYLNHKNKLTFNILVILQIL